MTGQEEELVPASPACRPQRCGMSRWPPAHRARAHNARQPNTL